MKRLNSLAIILLLCVCPLCADDTKQADEKEILAVLQNFEEGIVDKDAGKLAGIFVYPGAPLLGVRDGVFKGKFDEKRNTAEAFVTTVTGPAKMKERLFDHEIVINNGIATVNCKYEFYLNGKMTNYGNDIFSLVKTSGGWKILSVVYTVTLSE